jgi:sulfur-oxidizing protein SoxX
MIGGTLQRWIVTHGLLATLATATVCAAPSTLPGKAIAFDRNKGNCLACHVIADGELPGDIGPPLVNLRQRYPNKARLRVQVYDATINNPNTPMPPFGRHRILSNAEIDQIVDYLFTL